MLKTNFEHGQIDFETLKSRAFNHRWAEQEAGIIPLTAADPDFRVAPEITESIQEYISKGYFSYGPALGYDAFRSSVASWYSRKHHLDVDPTLVLGFNSAAEALDKVAMLLFEDGGNALIPDPVDFLFQTSINRNNGSAKTFGFNLDDGKINMNQLIEAIDTDTRAIYLCNPNNPSGQKISDEDIRQIVQVAITHDLYIVSDEIWLDIYYEEQLKSVAAYSEEAKKRTIIVSGLSKSFGLAGLRIGYCICPSVSFMEELLEKSGHFMTIGGLSTLSQVASTAALTKCDYWLDDFRSHLMDVRNYLCSELNQVPAYKLRVPKGTYLAFIALDPNLDESKIAEDIKDKVQVALVPGSARWFGPAASGHLRLCFSTSKENIREAVSRLKDYANNNL